MKKSIVPVAVVIALAFLGITVGYAVGWNMAPEHFDLGGPFFGSRSDIGPLYGAVGSTIGCAAGCNLGYLVIIAAFVIKWIRSRGKPTAGEEG